VGSGTCAVERQLTNRKSSTGKECINPERQAQLADYVGLSASCDVVVAALTYDSASAHVIYPFDEVELLIVNSRIGESRHEQARLSVFARFTNPKYNMVLINVLNKAFGPCFEGKLLLQSIGRLKALLIENALLNGRDQSEGRRPFRHLLLKRQDAHQEKGVQHDLAP
jgi:hypothetical protein